MWRQRNDGTGVTGLGVPVSHLPRPQLTSDRILRCAQDDRGRVGQGTGTGDD